MKIWIRALSIASLICSQLVGWVGHAAIERTSNIDMRNRGLLLSCPLLDFSRGFDLAAIRPVAPVAMFSESDMRRVLPESVSQGTDGSTFAAQVVDRSLSNFWNSDTMRNSTFGRTALKVEKSMTGNVVLGGHEPESIKHNLKFAMQAAQTRAIVTYEGVTNAQVTYQVAQAKLDFEIRENLPSLKTQLVYNHVNQRDLTSDMVSLRWAW